MQMFLTNFEVAACDIWSHPYFWKYMRLMGFFQL